MYGYSMERFEIMGDAMDEIQEWENFMEDTLSHPWN